MKNSKTVFITGAGSGIGAAVARRFSHEGWFVGLYDLNLTSVEALAEDLGDHCCSGLIDVTDRTIVEQAFNAFAKKTNGRLDAMINNAGLFQDKPFVEADSDFLELMMRVNMDGVVNCARDAYPLLKNTPDSHLVNLGSASSIYGVPNNAVYSSTKFFVRGLTEALRIEWEDNDITVNIVMPSYVATPMTDGVSLSHDKKGVLLTTDEVSAAIYQAAISKKMYWIMPGSARFQQFLVKILPLSWLHWVSKKLMTS